MLSDLIKVKERVEYLLQEYPPLRDDDKKLWICYLAVFCDARRKVRTAEDPWTALLGIVYDKDTPTMESIRRTRQKFQEHGKFMGTKRMEKLEEAEEVRSWAKGRY